MMIDSIPPAPPQGLSGSIDSTGLVQLSWNLGKEENLKGYNIYYSNSKDHVFTTLNNHPIQDTIYTDSIQIKTLTEEIYYFIKALDVNYSLSSSSDTIELKRPDLIAPTSPVITDYFVSKEGITIKWQNSTSHDAVKTLLYRKRESQDYVKVANFNIMNEATTYQDTLVSANQLYVYALKTQDDDSLYSEFSLPVKIKMGFKDDAEKIENLMVIKREEEDHLTLSWTNSAENVDYYIIYRAVDGRNFKTYSTVKSEYNTFKDHFLKLGSKYEYTVVIQFKDGRTSGFGKIVAHVN
jgi:fibronectin type 3 domain-containing protein